jgi:hypothetical protein
MRGRSRLRRHSASPVAPGGWWSLVVRLLDVLKLGNHEAHAALVLLSLIGLRWLLDRRSLDLDFDVAAECPQSRPVVGQD